MELEDWSLQLQEFLLKMTQELMDLQDLLENSWSMYAKLQDQLHLLQVRITRVRRGPHGYPTSSMEVRADTLKRVMGVYSPSMQF